ncbi:MAG: RNA polymerase-binding protein DksA [Deltaproteobacteria bacterium]|nr:RNA polymerase-binding protein DksA [Deltaproteobacteria bacterium]
MNKKELKKFRELLEERRQDILTQAESTKEKGMVFDPDDLPDEVDLAASEADQSMNLRLRDRERVLLRKVDKAIQKIEAGEYGICESCGEEIGAKRLLARPVTDLCIKCKEEQERVERSYAES